KFYNFHKNHFNAENIESQILRDTDENLIYEYELKLNTEEDTETIQTRVDQLITSINNETFEGEKQIAENFIAFDNTQHLYTPLISLDVKRYQQKLKLSPIALDESEKRFADDLVTYYQTNFDKFDNQKVFLLRNQSKKGIGFFVDTNNFYPDFILWIINDTNQHIAFRDPKGIRNSRSIADPKIQVHNFLKEKIEPQLVAENIVLSSFIISNTRLMEVNWKEDLQREDFHNANVYFQVEDNHLYISEILRKMIGN